MNERDINIQENCLNKKEYYISFIRMIATILIVSCHILQHYNNELAWWFNVGVQIFLFISGYLYGVRNNVDTILFYKKSFKKLFLDYYIYITAVVFFILFTHKVVLSIYNIIGLYTFQSTINGLEHLWFMTYIILCYLLVPFLTKMSEKWDYYKDTKYILYTVMLIFLIEVFMFFLNLTAQWIICFVLGMIFHRIEEKKKHLYNKILIFIVFLAIVMNSIEIYTKYFYNKNIVNIFYISFCNYAHVFLAIFLFYFLRGIYKLINKNKLKRNVQRLLDFSDKVSYDIYLVHHIYILGPYQIMLTNNKYLNIVIVILATLLTTFLLRMISNKVLYIIKKRKNKTINKVRRK